MTHAFPTRRSSGLGARDAARCAGRHVELHDPGIGWIGQARTRVVEQEGRQIPPAPCHQIRRAEWFARADVEVNGAVAAIRCPHQPAWIAAQRLDGRSEEHTSELQSLMRTSYAVFCLKKKQYPNSEPHSITT